MKTELVKALKVLRAYFGENSKTLQQHRMYAVADRAIKSVANVPKMICYCGSLRFIEQFKEVEYQSVLDGNIALLPCCMFVDIERKHGAESDYKQKADELHKRKIDICDEVFVLNVGGYIGQSTRSEIDYALKIGKPIKYLESPDINATKQSDTETKKVRAKTNPFDDLDLSFSKPL